MLEVVRIDRCLKLENLEPGQRFRCENEPESLWQLTCRLPSDAQIVAHRDKDGHKRIFSRDTLVEHVKGRWVPEEAEGLVAVKDTPSPCIVEWNGQLWHKACLLEHSNGYLQGVEDGLRQVIHADTLVRVVNCKLVEIGDEEE